MTNLSQIERDLDRDAAEWYEKPYDRHIPDSVCDVFKRALLNVPPSHHNMPAPFLRKLVAKKVDELTRADVGLMVNVIFNSPIGHYNLGKEFPVIQEEVDAALSKLEDLGKLRDEYNKESKDKADSLFKKWKTLAALKGVIVDKNTAQYQPKIHQV